LPLWWHGAEHVPLRTWYSNTKQLQVAGIKMDTGVVKLTGTLDEGEQLKVWF